MMTKAKVISVDPGKRTTGALHPEVTEKLARRLRVSTNYGKAEDSFVSFLFPTKNCGFNFSLIILGLRLLVGGLFIFNGLNSFLGAGTATPEIAIALISVGTALCLGLLTRIAASIPAVYFSFLTINSISAGLIDELSLIYAFVSIVACIAGPGWFSLDCGIRRAIEADGRRERRERKLAEDRLSYKAFRCESH